MSNTTADVLFETLAAIDKHTSRISNLEVKSKDTSTKLELTIKELERQIEASSKSTLKEILKSTTRDSESLVDTIISTIAENIGKLSINGGNITVNVDTSDLSKEISKLVNIKPITIEASPVRVEIDTKGLLSKYDNNSILVAAITKQIAESNKENRLLFKEIASRSEVKSEPEVTESPVKTIKIIRDQNNLIQSLEIVRED